MRVWKQAVRAMGGSSTILQDHIDDLQAELADLKARHELLAIEPPEYRKALGQVARCAECDPCRNLARQTLDLPAITVQGPPNQRVFAYLLLDDVFALIDERACSGDVQEAIHKLWRVLEHPGEVADDQAEQE